MQVPETRYARSGDVNIAYQVVGDGPLDLLHVPGWVSNVEFIWSSEPFAHFLRRLSSFSRLILLRGQLIGRNVVGQAGAALVAGVAVHTGARVSTLAAPGEVLVSRTVTDLTAGSGLVFEPRGEHELTGVPGTWQVFAAI